MAFSSNNPVAVVIDAESVSVADAVGAIAALAEKFPPLILHAFGDFRLPELCGWCELLDELGGQALQVTPTDGHDNSLHICMTMNVMEILHSGQASAICIFCGNGDFSQLAVRVRKAGLPVLGFGTEESGATMAPWFDSWQDIDVDIEYPGDDEAGVIDQPAEAAREDVSPAAPAMAEADAEETPQPAESEQPEIAVDRLAGFRPIMPMPADHRGEAEEASGSSQNDHVTSADIEAALNLAHEHGVVRADADYFEHSDPAGDEDLEDFDVMEAIEGKSECRLARIRDVPPLSDEKLNGRLTEDATLLLSNFIADNTGGNGYALLDDVAHAATAVSILVPDEMKSHPGEHLKRLVAEDRRFEITTLPMGDGEPEFIRRV